MLFQKKKKKRLPRCNARLDSPIHEKIQEPKKQKNIGAKNAQDTSEKHLHETMLQE